MDPRALSLCALLCLFLFGGSTGEVFNAVNLPLSVPDQGEASLLFNVDKVILIEDLIIRVAGSMYWAGELSFRLETPDGQMILLKDDNEFCSSTAISVGWSDNGLTSYPCPFSTGQIYAPQESLLAAVAGTASFGTWKVLIADDSSIGDAGSFTSASIEVLGQIFPIYFYPQQLVACSSGPVTGILSNQDIQEIVTFDITGLPAGVTVDMPLPSLGYEQSANVTFQVSGTTAEGLYPITFTSSTGETFNAVLQLVRNAQALLDPGNGALIDTLRPVFQFSNTTGAVRIEVSTTSNFSNIVWMEEQVHSPMKMDDFALEPQAVYYWRVTDYTCGLTSEVFSFSTPEVRCLRVGTQPEQRFAPDSGSVSSSIFVPFSDQIVDVRLFASGYSSRIIFLDISLSSPGTTKRMVFDAFCAQLEGAYNVTLDDRVTVSTNCNHETTSKPVSPFGVYTGQSAYGTWTIEATSFASFTDLKEWSLELCMLPNPDRVAVSPQKLTMYPACNVEEKIIITSGDVEDVSVMINTVPEGLTASLSSDTIPIGGQAILTVVYAGAQLGLHTIGIQTSSSSRILSACIHVDVEHLIPPQPLCPGANSENWSPNVTFSWVGNSPWYTFTLEKDNQVVVTYPDVQQLTTVGLYNYGLSVNSSYSWVVTEPICGLQFTANFSTLAQSDMTCVQYFAEDLPIPIANRGTLISNITVNEALGTLVQVSLVNVVGTHNYMGDLEFTLISPQGPSVRVYNGGCYSDDNFNWARIGDGELGTYFDCPGTGMGFKPSSPLLGLMDTNPVGQWGLKIYNDWVTVGQFTNWGLELCYSDNAQSVCDADESTFPETSTSATNTETNTCTCSTVITSSETQDTSVTQGNDGGGPDGGADADDGGNAESSAVLSSPLHWMMPLGLLSLRFL